MAAGIASALCSVGLAFKGTRVHCVKLESPDPTYTTLPSALSVGEEETDPPVAKAHFLLPSAVFTAYKLLSADPTYTTLPSALSVGEEYPTGPPVAKAHFLLPSAVFTAYKLLSSDPTYTTLPSALNVGEEE